MSFFLPYHRSSDAIPIIQYLKLVGSMSRKCFHTYLIAGVFKVKLQCAQLSDPHSCSTVRHLAVNKTELISF